MSTNAARCKNCGALSFDGILTHSLGCIDRTPPKQPVYSDFEPPRMEPPYADKPEAADMLEKNLESLLLEWERGNEHMLSVVRVKSRTNTLLRIFESYIADRLATAEREARIDELQRIDAMAYGQDYAEYNKSRLAALQAKGEKI
jgi:hypothetical protein